MSRKTVWQATLTAAALASVLPAHGGVYRGPGGVVPPSAGSSGSGSSSPGSSGGSASSPVPGATTTASGPATAGPASPAGAATGSVGRGPAGTPVGDDLTRWSYWWEFRKDSFLRLKAAVHETGVVKFSDEYFMGGGPRDGVDTLRPSPAQVLGEIVPALHGALASTDQRDITSSCLVALAKVGVEDRDHELLPALRARLRSRDQEIRETAALALGISQRTGAVPDLVALVRDDDRGRKLVDRSEVDDRTRAFAAYGLGLIAWASPNAGVKRVVLDSLRPVLEDTGLAGMNVPVAVVNAIGLLRPEAADRDGDVLRDDALEALRRFYDADLGVGRQLVQAHVPTAVAELLGPGADAVVRQAWARRFATELRPDKASEQAARRNRALAQSAALALGELAGPNEAGAPDAWISEALIAAFEDGRDLQTGYFALTALGRIGGEQNRAFLLRVLDSGTKALEKPWAAIALGVNEHRRVTRAGSDGHADAQVIAAIVRQLDAVKNPETLAAFAVALGLCRARSAAQPLRELLDANRHQDELAGYLCIGLALMDDRGAVDQIRDIVMTSSRRPQLLLQAATALGRLGDKTTALLLMEQMSATEQNLAVLSSLAFAVGQIGDRRTVVPLIGMVADEGRTELARAFTVVALGGVADKETEPWNAKVGRQVNYRAAVETLTNQASGILDIL